VGSVSAVVAETKILSWMTIGISRPPFSMKAGRPLFETQAGFECVANYVSGGDARVCVDAGDTPCMIVVPDESRALIIGIVILRLAERSARVQDRVVEKTLTNCAGA
jgi:hypothetical protein